MNSFGVRMFEHRANHSSILSALLAVALKGGYDDISLSQWPQCGRARSAVLTFISTLPELLNVKREKKKHTNIVDDLATAPHKDNTRSFTKMQARGLIRTFVGKHNLRTQDH